MDIPPQVITWILEGLGATIAGVVVFMLRAAIDKLRSQDTHLENIQVSIGNLERQIALDLRGLDVRLSFIEGQMGIKK